MIAGIFCGLIFFSVFLPGEIPAASGTASPITTGLHTSSSNNPVSQQNIKEKLLRIPSTIQDLASAGDKDGLIRFSDTLLSYIPLYITDSSTLAEIRYYAGVSYLLADKHSKAIQNLTMCIAFKKNLGVKDEQLAKALFNSAIAADYMGDFIRVIDYMTEYAGLAASIYGDNSTEMAEAYSALAGASIECLDYDSFRDYSFRALGILNRNEDVFTGSGLSSFYTTMGVGFARTSDFAKARLYLEKAESVIDKNDLPHDQYYINLINSLAFTYGSLGLKDKEEEYLARGIDLAVNNSSYLAFNLINSYAVRLGKSGQIGRGEELLSTVVGKAEKSYGKDSRFYIEMLQNYAGYLVRYGRNPALAQSAFEILFTYLRNHNEDMIMRSQVLSVYARALHLKGDNQGALAIIHELLTGTASFTAESELFTNPPIDSIPVNGSSLNLLTLKYDLLRGIYSAKNDIRILEAAAETSDLMISLLEKIRVNISEEESRIVLSENYRALYLNAICDYELCYRLTADRKFLEKAFGFAEKSKVAGLLAATRQLNAVQFHIPQNLAEKEKSLQREISFYNSRISIEKTRENPDPELILDWNENLIRAVAERDSLVNTFERDYPGYFTLKYNTRVPAMKEIPSIIGRNYNYINYVVSDSLLYIFLVNRKHQELITYRTDSSFIKMLGDFRILLSEPSQSEPARTKFNNYQQTGFDLYNILVKPAERYLISNNLLISPDNILSYLPFEAFLSSEYSGTEILYRKLDYLMKYYNISYAYSATFMLESQTKGKTAASRLVAYAPSYPPSIRIDSLTTGAGMSEMLYDLPFARQEAEYVAGITDGKLYLSHAASETGYKSEASAYKIIHMSMHTIVNDTDPMNSAMIFGSTDDSDDDGLLYTYEVYGIPLSAKMVVLSSCNTGSGLLSSGEGIMSLARGFLYSGSRSVVMSLWKIEDRSGTDIVKMFYDNLKKGMSKSKALRKAREKYLRDASQLRSHPYFWSTLVIFGDNEPVFFPFRRILIILATAAIASLLIIFYFRKRRYS